MNARSLALDRSLAERRRVLTGLLAAMQRLGRSPPPALLVQPDDAIGALRSAMMLGRVVPAVQQETAALGREIDELSSLTAAMEVAKTTYADRLSDRRIEEARLESLIAERRQAETRSQAESQALSARAERLSARAATLEQLIAALDKADAPQGQEAARPPETGYDIASLRENMPRLRGNAAFSTLKGVLNRPISGETILGFGQVDAGGRSSSGMRFAGAFGDRVTAPADAEVLYAGPFRSYGQLLILNAGDGYHIVLAGMAEIDVDVGQFVLAGNRSHAWGRGDWLSEATGSIRQRADRSSTSSFARTGNRSIQRRGGRNDHLEGRGMIRKLSILFAGALMGATAMTAFVGPHSGVANAAGSDTYRQLAIFGDVFERVRAQYVEQPDDQKLIETAINGMLTSLDPIPVT